MKEALREVGLTEGETDVYLALLETGVTTVGDVIKKSGISGSKVYEVLDRLIDKGLASKIIKNNVNHYEPTRPERIIDYLDEKEERIEKQKNNIQSVMPQILSKYDSVPKSQVKVFSGWEGIKSANEDIIKTLKKGDEWLSMGLTEQPKSWEIYFNKRQKARAEKGIVHKHLLNEKYKSLHEKRKSLPNTEFRFLPESFEMPTSTEIYNDKVIIMVLLKEDPLAIMMEGEAIASTFRKYFNALWKTATQP